MRRRVLQLLLALTALALPMVASITPARADNASALLTLVNSLRAAHGAGPLYADPTLTRVAQAWSAHMAASGLTHDPNISAQLNGGWTKLGENIGAGGSIPIVFNAFVNSPFHLENMIDKSYNLTGIGVVTGANGTLWITQDFEAKPGATPATTKPPATTATTARPSVTAAPATTAAPKTTTAPTTTPTTTPPTTATTATTAAAPPEAALPPSPGVAAAAPGSARGAPLGDLAGATSLSAHHHSAITWTGWVIALALTGLGSVVGSAWLVNRSLRRR
jgi:Cysteine-rich secretory protein family